MYGCRLHNMLKPYVAVKLKSRTYCNISPSYVQHCLCMPVSWLVSSTIFILTLLRIIIIILIITLHITRTLDRNLSHGNSFHFLDWLNLKTRKERERGENNNTACPYVWLFVFISLRHTQTSTYHTLVSKLVTVSEIADCRFKTYEVLVLQVSRLQTNVGHIVTLQYPRWSSNPYPPFAPERSDRKFHSGPR